eukprot:scaffold45588_cov31-Tisochrysis_lutea.AAC.5
MPQGSPHPSWDGRTCGLPWSQEGSPRQTPRRSSHRQSLLFELLNYARALQAPEAVPDGARGTAHKLTGDFGPFASIQYERSVKSFVVMWRPMTAVAITGQQTF